MEFPAINGLGHIDLTVTDGERSARWWEEVMGFQLVATRERPGFRLWNMFHPSFLAIGLVAFDDPATTRFDERAIGLDHLALRVPDRVAIEDGRSTSTISGSRTLVCRTRTGAR